MLVTDLERIEQYLWNIAIWLVDCWPRHRIICASARCTHALQTVKCCTSELHNGQLRCGCNAAGATSWCCRFCRRFAYGKITLLLTHWYRTVLSALVFCKKWGCFQAKKQIRCCKRQETNLQGVWEYLLNKWLIHDETTSCCGWFYPRLTMTVLRKSDDQDLV